MVELQAVSSTTNMAAAQSLVCMLRLRSHNCLHFGLGPGTFSQST